MKRYLHLLLLAFISLAGCVKKGTAIVNLAALEGGKIFATPTGTVIDKFVLKRFPDAKLEYYNSTLDCTLAVQSGKADAAAYDLPVIKTLSLAMNEGLLVLPELIEDDRYGFGFRRTDTALKQALLRGNIQFGYNDAKFQITFHCNI